MIKNFILAFLCLTFFACNNQRKQSPKPTTETPKALQQKSTFSVETKRSYEDLVESLYKELIAKDKRLKELEDNIDVLVNSENDSTESFQSFDTKNKNYYGAANMYISQITDSALRIKMQTIIKTSSENYDHSIQKKNNLLEKIAANKIVLNDLHTVLKITKTLPVIEKFQKENQPPTKPLENFIKEQDKAIKLVDSLIDNK